MTLNRNVLSQRPKNKENYCVESGTHTQIRFLKHVKFRVMVRVRVVFQARAKLVSAKWTKGVVKIHVEQKNMI